MLKLSQIVKTYAAGNTQVEALRGIDIEFRKNEFVAVLGPSGCGKTTLLNIIGGLDRYDSGDLSISGKSTRQFKDADWDSYRNHSIGFVFQSYNLIPHQTVLANVELALTLSGVSRAERRQRAIEVLQRVGLGDQLHKKPNQMSGGQMQRVAIARALVNDPEILLADEPTGALDSETSVQIMEILREVAKDKLIIMVTHNPELAQRYATRTVKLLDGQIVGDSDPYTSEDGIESAPMQTKKTSMSFFTAFSLSLQNLLTKKGRTFMVCFAGSIGIIGIALILSLSNGFQSYINKVQEDTLSSYPITIQSESMNIGDLMTSMGGVNETDENSDDGKIHANSMMSEMVSTMLSKVETNDLEQFKKYLEEHEEELAPYLTDIQYSYPMELYIYGKEDDGTVFQVNPSTLFASFEKNQPSFASSSSMSMGFEVFEELLDNQELLDSQYTVLAGHWPQAYNEVVLIADENNRVSDVVLYALGLKDPEEADEMVEAMMSGKEFEPEDPNSSYTYDEILSKSYKLFLPTDSFTYDEETGLWKDHTGDSSYIRDHYEDGIDLKIVGIVRPQEGAAISGSSSGVGYTKALTDYMVEQIGESEVLKAQLDQPDTDIFTGIDFPKDDEETVEITIDDVYAYIETLPPEQQASMAPYLEAMTEEQIVEMFKSKIAPNQTDATYEGNLEKIGYVNAEQPSSINLYAVDFAAKEYLTDFIQRYNDDARAAGEEERVISYTDYIGLMLSSVSTIINAITYVLIAFVGISLVVSSIMIGIITYISVLERTKEIGILRSIGASKRDISRVFNAETLIIGLIAGGLGIGITLLLNIPANFIIEAISGVPNVASLPPVGGIILVGISVLLTVLAGLIPAGAAKKKDPVVALRTE